MSLTLRVQCAHLLPSGWDAATFGPLEIFRNNPDADIGLKAHEDHHIACFWQDPAHYDTKYSSDHMFAMQTECDCYAIQLQVYRGANLYPAFYQTALGYMGSTGTVGDIYHWPADVQAQVKATFDAALAKLGVTT